VDLNRRADNMDVESAFAMAASRVRLGKCGWAAVPTDAGELAVLSGLMPSTAHTATLGISRTGAGCRSQEYGHPPLCQRL
jgi:hypothetical protein